MDPSLASLINSQPNQSGWRSPYTQQTLDVGLITMEIWPISSVIACVFVCPITQHHLWYIQAFNLRIRRHLWYSHNAQFID